MITRFCSRLLPVLVMLVLASAALSNSGVADSRSTPRPKIVIVNPDNHVKVGHGTSVACAVHVMVPKNGKLPDVTMLTVSKGKVIYDSFNLELKEVEPGLYRRELKLNAPKTPGNYTMRAEGKDIAEKKTTVTCSASIEIEVK